MIGKAIEDAMVTMVVIVFLVGLLLGLFFAFGVPWLWSLVKPIIHAVTA